MSDSLSFVWFVPTGCAVPGAEGRGEQECRSRFPGGSPLDQAVLRSEGRAGPIRPRQLSILPSNLKFTICPGNLAGRRYLRLCFEAAAARRVTAASETTKKFALEHAPAALRLAFLSHVVVSSGPWAGELRHGKPHQLGFDESRAFPHPPSPISSSQGCWIIHHELRKLP